MPVFIERENLTADSNTAAKAWHGGDGTFRAEGDFGGGTATLQSRMIGESADTWHDVGSDTTLTSDGEGNFYLAECQLRVNLSGATDPDVYVEVRTIKDPK